MMQHSLERTSPLGGPFRGTCVLCGKTNLTMADFFGEECPNPGNVSEDEAVLNAIRGPQPAEEAGTG